MAARLLQHAGRLALPLDVWLIDPARDTGCGPAYGTGDPRHLFNVPAGRMSAFTDDPGHFVRWVARREPGRADPGAYVPRMLYGTYLSDVLDGLARQAGGARLHRLYYRVAGARSGGSRLSVTLDFGRTVHVDAAVLALGNFPPGCAWAQPSLRASYRFVADPWTPGALDAVPADADVLLVGTGLTMVDVAIGLDRPGRVVHAISRHGIVPRPHVTASPPPPPPPGIPDDCGLDGIRRRVLRHLARSRLCYGDWRPGFDSLRTVTTALWRQLPPADRTRFLTTDLRLWEAHRHRMPPATAAALRAAQDSGRLRIGAGEVADAVVSDRGVRVRLRDARVLDVGAVVNCTGAQGDVAAVDDPFVRSLLASRLARAHPAGLGFDTYDNGRLRSPARAVEAPLWALGSLCRGELFASTAIPEIRAQADEVAAAVLRLMVEKSTSRQRERYGLRLSTTAEAADAYNQALVRILRVENGAVPLLRCAVTADPGFAVGHAALALLGHECGAEADVPGGLRAAQQAARARADERERSFVAAVCERIRENGAVGAAALLGHVRDFPRDALVMSTVVPTISFDGVTSGAQAWELIESLDGTYGGDWWFLGQLAFIRQEQARWEEAEALAARALAAEPGAGHAVHARTHVFYETGQLQAGLDSLDAWIDEHGPGAKHRAHFSWHAALHELMLDAPDAVRRRYWAQLAPPRVTDTRAVVDSASLLWR